MTTDTATTAEAPPAAKESAEPQVKRSWTFRHGALPLMILLPPLTYYMWICMVYYGGNMVIPSTKAGWLELVSHVPGPTITSVLIFFGWMLFQGMLQVWAPGRWVEGRPLNDGSRLKYRMNGLFSWWFTWVVLVGAVLLGWIRPAVLYDQFGPLLTTANIFAFAFTLYLYFHGKVATDDGQVLKGGFFYQYFMGTARHPRIANFDFKLFCEARPGLIGWVVLNLSIAAKQYEMHGTISVPMIMVCVFHFWYIADYYFNEDAILSTWDIRHENFGWMLVWGDLVWVPFTYTLQALYLVHHPHDLPIWAIAGICVLNFGGYYIFRSANLQKHKFRKNPDKPIWGKKPEYIKTKQGQLLLTSGWWGKSRHANYLGDLMMGLAWCLPCLFNNLLPYFYIIYFTILLVHRERRDHIVCGLKYGKDWEAYTAKVRHRILPGVY
jgi:protein-S-isoprenylcysteine O-methyltransferase Ste14